MKRWESTQISCVLVTVNSSTSNESVRSKRAADRQSLHRRRRAATSRPERVWPDGIIPYVISGNFSGEFWVKAIKLLSVLTRELSSIYGQHVLVFVMCGFETLKLSNFTSFQAVSEPFSVRRCVTGRSTLVWYSLSGRLKKATLFSPTDLVGESGAH